MGIPRKKSRPVEFEGRQFRYLIKESHIQDNPDQKELSLTIQEDRDEPGAPLRTRLPYGHFVSPERICEIIRDGMRLGWNPSQHGATFSFNSGE